MNTEKSNSPNLIFRFQKMRWDGPTQVAVSGSTLHTALKIIARDLDDWCLKAIDELKLQQGEDYSQVMEDRREFWFTAKAALRMPMLPKRVFNWLLSLQNIKPVNRIQVDPPFNITVEDHVVERVTTWLEGTSNTDRASQINPPYDITAEELVQEYPFLGCGDVFRILEHYCHPLTNVGRTPRNGWHFVRRGASEIIERFLDNSLFEIDVESRSLVLTHRCRRAPFRVSAFDAVAHLGYLPEDFRGPGDR